jgi:antitoxin component YwqK of YwqJK toxin-antitoxin module
MIAHHKYRYGDFIMKLWMLLLLSLSLFATEKIYKYGDLEERHDGVLIEIKTQNLANGIGNFFYETGELRGETPFKNGIREGMGKTYYISGKLHGETPFKNDKIEGLKKEYYESGKLQSETLFKNDKAEGIAKLYYESGKLQSETPFKNNKAEGIAKVYYESGKIANEIEFKESKALRGFAYDEKGNKVHMSNAELDRISNIN